MANVAGVDGTPRGWAVVFNMGGVWRVDDCAEFPGASRATDHRRGAGGAGHVRVLQEIAWFLKVHRYVTQAQLLAQRKDRVEGNCHASELVASRCASAAMAVVCVKFCKGGHVGWVKRLGAAGFSCAP